MANSWGFLTGLHIELLSDLGHTPTKPNRALVTRQRDIQLSNLVLDEQNVVCPFLFILQKKILTNSICRNDENLLTEKSQTHKHKCCVVALI